jgi:ketosteroid isomerase-like protein
VIEKGALIAHSAFDALDRHDIARFSLLCDPDVELCRFTAPRDQHAWQNSEYAMVPIRGREPVAAWLREVFDAFPGMRFVLEMTDLVGESVFCDARFSPGEDPLMPCSFVLTMSRGQILGFEVFHPDVEGVEHEAHYSIAWGQFRVRGRASNITPPRRCAWIFRRDDRGIPTSVRIYRSKAQAIEAAHQQHD